MRIASGRPALLGCLGLALSGCVTVDPDDSYQRAAVHIQQATGEAEVFQPGQEEDAAARVAALQADGLTVGEAVQIALLNQRSLQASFFRIGSAQAELVQAGLLANPSLSAALRFPSGGGRAGFELGLVESLAEIWQLPARERAATRELERVILEVAREATVLAQEVKHAYYHAATAEHSAAIAAETLQIAQELLRLARARQEAGAGNAIDVNVASAEVLSQQIAARRAQLAVAEARSFLGVLLGLTHESAALPLVDGLPEPPGAHFTLARLLELAASHRLDLRAAERSVALAAARIQEEERLFLRVVDVGVSVEREERRAGESDELSVGPTLDLELPLFHQNQAGVARARFQHAEAAKRLEGLRLAVDQEVHRALLLAEAAWDLTRLSAEGQLPAYERGLELAQNAYRVGEVPFLYVLEAQRRFLAARQDHLDLLHDSAEARADLEAVTGLPLERISSEAADSSPERKEHP